MKNREKITERVRIVAGAPDTEEEKIIPASPAAAKRIAAETALSRDDKTLFNLLKELRVSIAKEKNIPAYLVFSNAALEEMASKKPLSREEFLEINGVGSVKSETYGELFITAIKSYCEGKGE